MVLEGWKEVLYPQVCCHLLFLSHLEPPLVPYMLSGMSVLCSNLSGLSGVTHSEYSSLPHSKHSLTCSGAPVSFFSTLQGSSLPIDALGTFTSCSGLPGLSQASLGEFLPTCHSAHPCTHSDASSSSLGLFLGSSLSSNMPNVSASTTVCISLTFTNPSNFPLSSMLGGSSSHCGCSMGL